MIEVEAPDGSIVEFPDNMQPEQIQSAMQKAFPPEQETQQPTGSPDTVGAYGRALLTRPMLGGSFSDELLAVPATMGTTAYRAMTGQPVDVMGDYGKNLESIQNQYKRDEIEAPTASFIGDIAGDIRTGLGATKLLGKNAPKTAQALANFGRKHPVLSSIGIGGVSGGVYGFGQGEGSAEERLEEAGTGALFGGGLGSAGFLVGKGLHSLGKKMPLTEKFLKKKSQRNSVVFKDADNVPVTQTKGEQIRLPEGARTGDVNKMRLEEAARQGGLGDDLQAQMAQVDDAVKGDAQAVIEGISKSGTSDDLLEGGLSRVQKRFKAQKALQGKLMNKRNDAIARAKIYKDYTKDTLASDLKELKGSPDFFVHLRKYPQLQDDFKFLDDLTKNKDVTSIQMAELQSWRRGLNDYKDQEGVLASQMAKTYDNWLDNIAEEAFKSGDSSVVDAIVKANGEYSKFKNMYGTNKMFGQSKVVQDIVEKSELTPDHLVNMTFGKSLKGINTSNQVVKRLLKTMPEGARREALRTDLKAGLINRALEGAKDSKGISIAKLKTNLSNLKKNRAFTDNLATKEELQIMDGLLMDLTKYVDATTRRDVYSPSGPLVLRGLEKLMDGLGYSFSLVGGRALTEPVKGAMKQAKIAPDRKIVEDSIRKFSDEFDDIIKQKFQYYGSMTGGPVAAQTE